MMNQFRVEINSAGNMYIYCRDVPHYGSYLERCVCLRQWRDGKLIS
jgi:hypothetical protein